MLQCRHIRAYFQPVSLSDIDRLLYAGVPLPSNALAVTVDDGHRDFFQVAYPIFCAHGIPVTMFLTTGFLDRNCWLWTDQVAHMFTRTRCESATISLPEGDRSFPLTSPDDRFTALRIVKAAAKRMPHAARMTLVHEELPRLLRVHLPAVPPAEYEPLSWDEVRVMQRDGVSFGAHTLSHPILSSIASEDDLRAEIRGSKARIEQELDTPAATFSYPNGTSGDIDDRTIEEVKAAGFRSAVIAERGVNHRTTNPYLLYRIPVEPLTSAVYFGREILRK